MASETGPSSSSERSLAPPPKPEGDEGSAMATAAQPELARGGTGPAPPPQDREAVLGNGAAPAAETEVGAAGDDDYGSDSSAAWAAGPATGAWSFEADDLDDQGSDAPFGTAPVWEAGYEEPGIDEEGQGWYDPGNVGWDGDEATAGPTGWYSEGLYQDEYPTGYVRPHREAVAAYQDYGTAVIPRTSDEGQAVVPDPPLRRANGPWPELAMIAAVAVIIAAVILAVTSADKADQNASQTIQTTVPTTAAQTGATGPSTKAPPSTAAPSTVPSTAPRTVPSTTAPKVTTVAPPRAVALPVTPPVQLSLIRSWLATNPGGVGLELKDVAGTVPQEVFYAKQPQTLVYWALAAFQPSQLVLAEQSTATGQADLAQFQGTEYVFNWRAGPTWTELGYVSTGDCPGQYVPSSVLAAWGLCGLGSPGA
jgi:hypothetical protein